MKKIKQKEEKFKNILGDKHYYFFPSIPQKTSNSDYIYITHKWGLMTTPLFDNYMCLYSRGRGGRIVKIYNQSHQNLHQQVSFIEKS